MRNDGEPMNGLVRSVLRRALSAAALLGAGAALAVAVRDDAGRTLEVAAPAVRIVSLAPHLTELLFAIGAGAQVVGIVAYSDHPEAARSVPQVGDSAQLDLERIVALRPDLIVAWRSGNSEAQLQRLAALRIPIYRSESRELGDISSTLRRLGALSGNGETAERQAQRFDAAVAKLRSSFAQRRKLRVFYQIWPQPLLTINGQHMISQALETCGARNVFADERALTPAVGEEAVLAKDPDAIVSSALPEQGAPTPEIDAWRRRKTLRAVALGNLIAVNPDTLHRSSHRIVEGIAELCAKLDAARERMRHAAAAPDDAAPAARLTR